MYPSIAASAQIDETANVIFSRREVVCIALCCALLATSWVTTPAHAQDDLFRKGPYLMDVTPTSIAVMVETTGDLQVGATATTPSGATVESQLVGGTGVHEIVLSGLTPATRYTYSIKVNGALRPGGEFVTAPLPDSEAPVSFVCYGDVRDDPATHRRIVDLIVGTAPDFVLGTGDLVHRGDNDSEWQSFFDAAAPFLRQAPYFPSLGNHEMYTRGGREATADNVGIQAYSRWFRVTSPPPVPSLPETSYSFRYGLIRGLVINDRQDWSQDGEAMRWLKATLASFPNDGATYHIAAMHHGIYSSGSHGENDELLEAGVDELFRNAGIDIIFSGHDHAYERGEVRGLKYVVSGGGGAPLYDSNAKHSYQQTFESSYHFTSVTASPTEFVLTAIRVDGSTLERCKFSKGTPWVCDTAKSAARESATTPGPDAKWSERHVAAKVTGGIAALGALMVLILAAHRRRKRGSEES